MKNVGELIRCLLISPEMLLLCLAFTAWYAFPSPFLWADKAIQTIDAWQMLLPFGALLAAVITLASNALFPSKNTTAITQWPRYPAFRLRVFCAIAIVGMGLLAATIGAFGRHSLPGGVAALLIACGYTIAGISVFTLLMASIVIRSLSIRGG